MRLAHGYTNDSVRDGTTVTKHYREPGAAERLLREATALQALAGHLPVPELLTTDPVQRTLQTSYLPARHGQELIDAGHAARVLLLCGRLLRQLQSLSPQLLPAGVGVGPVLVHGDFGLQNLLVAPRRWRVAALVDWEWVHHGYPVEDLAWAEWIVRMHHPQATPALSALFRGYGERPPWALRHAAMLEQCQWLLARASQQEERLATLWQRRVQATELFADAE
jgi:Ser/Thr protein kinase RdoA (MazF antagonist)